MAVFILLISACQPAVAPLTPTVDQGFNTPPIQSTDETITFENNGITLTVKRPDNWEYFSTEYGIVIGEQFGSVATEGQLQGLMTYVFTTPLEDYTADVIAGSRGNRAKLILDQITADPVYTANIAVSDTIPFNWDGYDASYYLLSGDDGNATIVIGVVIPEVNSLLSTSISAPYEQRDRIRPSLGVLLEGLAINNVRLSDMILDQIADPLVFPVFNSPQGR
ncbi:MAG: hypothetical protein MUF87_13050 [Anaerolineae bacterium]|nr:hypothetical protein [Anaerolineae bacterium]